MKTILMYDIVRAVKKPFRSTYKIASAFKLPLSGGAGLFRLFPLLLFILTGCAETPSPGATPTLEPSLTPTVTLVSTEKTVQIPDVPATLLIWLPPIFDPSSSNPAGNLLQARLDEFTKRRGVQIEVRIKAVYGPGGLLDSLSTANAAAPLALPDLILLPHDLLETAALKGLLFPIDNLTAPLDESDWYDYAQQLAYLQNSTFGLPFAGDALVMVYRPIVINEPPLDWDSALTISNPMVFPSADEKALFTLAQYLAGGGKIQDEEGRPILDVNTLTEVLTFYQEAASTGLMPFWITQYTTDEQAWQAYIENNTDMVVTWTSRYLGELPVDTTAAPILTPDGSPFTLAYGWVWALSNPHVERHAIGVELAEFLTNGTFLSDWTSTAGYLPPRSSALVGWSNAMIRSLVGQVVRSAQAITPTDVLTIVSPALQQATVDVLKAQTDPTTAAQAAAESVTAP